MIRFKIIHLSILHHNCPTVDCEWSEWSLGHCSKTCGTGERLMIRSKTVVEAYDGSCPGAVNATEACNMHNCPGKAF